MKINKQVLEVLSIEDLDKITSLINEVKEMKKKKNIFIEDLKRQAKENGFDFSVLMNEININEKNKVNFKYKKNINGIDKKWSGKGKQPNWIKDHISNGGNLAELVIK